MISKEAIDVAIYGEGNATKIADNFKHGHYISFIRNVLGKKVVMIENHEIDKRFYREEKEYIEGDFSDKLVFQLEDDTLIIVEPKVEESKIRFQFVAHGDSQKESDRNLIAVRETVLNYIDY
jgi:midasin (ATPase involved in ribosome maturation)